MKTFIKPFRWVSDPKPFKDFSLNTGWGCGYVVIPRNSPLYGVNYFELDNHVDVHGGLTFGQQVEYLKDRNWSFPEEITQGWVVGFDSGHHQDTIQTWPKERVEMETQNLREQLEELSRRRINERNNNT